MLSFVGTSWTFHSQCSWLSQQLEQQGQKWAAIIDNSFVALDTDIHTVTAFCSLLVFTGTEKGCQLSPVEIDTAKFSFVSVVCEPLCFLNWEAYSRLTRDFIHTFGENV